MRKETRDLAVTIKMWLVPTCSIAVQYIMVVCIWDRMRASAHTHEHTHTHAHTQDYKMRKSQLETTWISAERTCVTSSHAAVGTDRSDEKITLVRETLMTPICVKFALVVAHTTGSQHFPTPQLLVRLVTSAYPTEGLPSFGFHNIRSRL